MAESNGGPRFKKRGVRASRVRLERALAEADLEKKTQAALAERMADLEDLEAAPKDLVSKVFRERYVDPQTLERVARALGVEAETLYLEAPEQEAAASMPASPSSEEAPAPRPRISRSARIQFAALFSIAFLLFLLFTALAIRPAGPWCGLREAAARPQAAEGTLGVVVARFAGDPDNRAQQYLAASLASDRNLAPYTSVLAACARPRWDGPGELRRKLADIRERGREKLERFGAHVMLWGELDGDDIIVRFVSTRRDVSPVAMEISGRPLKVEEESLELRVPIGRPSEALADVKRFALEVIEPGDEKLARLRGEAMRAYDSSADWLRAAVVSQRNLRRTVDPSLDAQRWAAINMQLCYDLRLLGDYEADANFYRQALEACDAALAVRPRDRFPSDWALAQINKASSHVRLHYYAADREAAVAALRAAEGALSSVIESAFGLAPQREVTAQRNLGVVYLRLGELTEGEASSDCFDRGIALLKTALAAQDPSLQPLDWAITQQNICLALYQHGARLGPEDGAASVREAKTRCADAVRRLAPENAPLDWAMTQNNLAAATAILAQMEGDAAGLADAIDDFTAAQRVYTRARLPENWAEVELNLGELSCNLALMRAAPEEFDRARAYLDSALEVFIEKGNERYRRYAETLAASIEACDPARIDECVCGG